MLRSLEDFDSSVEMLLAHLAYEKKSQLFFKSGIKKYKGESCFESEFRSFFEESVSGSFVRMKIYSYKSSIISLYGYLERFIEDVIVEYLKKISEVCPCHEKLPSSIKKNHLNLSMDLINKIQKTKGWSGSDRKAKLSSAVGNMNKFLSEQGVLSINYAAFVSHTSNFRYDSIHEIFTKIGIESISKQSLIDKELINAICERNGAERDSCVKTLVSHLTTELDDLAHRRNEVAHGVRIDDIDSIELTISRINFIKSYVKAISSVIEKSISEYIFLVSEKHLIGHPDRIFTGINVVGFEGVGKNLDPSVSYSFKVGDMLFALNEISKEKCIYGKIKSLKCNNIDQDIIHIPCSENITIETDFEFSENFKKRSLYVVPRK